MLGKWLIFVGVSFFGLIAFQWLFYSGIIYSKTRTFFGYNTFFGYSPNSDFKFFLIWSALLSLIMILPNAISYLVAKPAYYDWFGERAWVLYLSFAAVNVATTLVVMKILFDQTPSRGSLIGLGFYIIGAIISVFW